MVLEMTLGAMAGLAATAAVPPLVGVLGFTAAGIAAGSTAAAWMSASAVASGSGVAAGSLVAILQSIGVAGLSTASYVAGTTGGAAGGALLGAILL